MAMRHIWAVTLLTLLVVSSALGQTSTSKAKPGGSTEDEAAIRRIVSHWQQAWDKFDSSVLEGDYADDADWINAFGVKNTGSAKIVANLSRTFKSPAVQGRRTTWAEPRVRFVRPDVALAYRDYKTVGQKDSDGREMPQRNTHSTWLLSKENGTWLIISQVISDDK